MIGALSTATDKETVMTQLSAPTTKRDRNLDPVSSRDRAQDLRCHYLSQLAGRVAHAFRGRIAALAHQVDRRLHHV